MPEQNTTIPYGKLLARKTSRALLRNFGPSEITAGTTGFRNSAFQRHQDRRPSHSDRIQGVVAVAAERTAIPPGSITYAN